MMIDDIRSTLSRALFVAAFATVCASAALAQSLAGSHAKIALLADESVLKPGQTASIGLLFDLEQGWHIYWVNPGDSGQAPRVQWNLPKGFRAGEIRWPVPVRLVTGTVVDYGYQGRVLLSLPLEVPADYTPGSPTVLAADVKYLICREVCIPASAHTSLQLGPSKASPTDAAATHRFFEESKDHWPKPLPAGAKVQATDNGKEFVLSVDTGTPEAKASFFPLEEDQLDNDAPQSVTAAGTRTQITLKKSDQLNKPVPVLKGVLVFSADRAYQVAAPVTARH